MSKFQKKWRCHLATWKPFIFNKLGVSKNNGTPNSSILIGFSIIHHPFWGTNIFGNTQLSSEVYCHRKPGAPTEPNELETFPTFTCWVSTHRYTVGIHGNPWAIPTATNPRWKQKTSRRNVVLNQGKNSENQFISIDLDWYLKDSRFNVEIPSEACFLMIRNFAIQRGRKTIPQNPRRQALLLILLQQVWNLAGGLKVLPNPICMCW